MNVFIINTGSNREKRYQIMTGAGNGFNHVFPGKLFDLNTAVEISKENNFNVVAIGTIWECLKKI